MKTTIPVIDDEREFLTRYATSMREKDHALFDRELGKVIHALRADEGGREKPPAPKL